MELLGRERRLRDFPLLKKLTYLNCSAVGPSPEPVIAAAAGFSRDRNHVNPERLEEWLNFMERVRGRVARLIGARPHEIAFTTSTGEGMNLVARGFRKLTRGSRVVLDDLDYPTNPMVWKAMAGRRGIKPVVVKSSGGAVPVEDFARAIDRSTRLVSLALVSHVNGYVHEVKKISKLVHDAGGYLLADAVQAVGAMPVNVRAMGIDFLSCGTYKWLLGPLGLAFLYVREDLLDQIEPLGTGWMQIEKTRDRVLEGARMLEYGTLHFQGFYELDAALTYLERIGTARIHEHNGRLGRMLHEGLRDRGLEVMTPQGNPHGIVTFAARDGKKLTRRLFRRGIGVQGRPGNVRVAPHFFNTSRDIDRFLDALDRSL